MGGGEHNEMKAEAAEQLDYRRTDEARLAVEILEWGKNRRQIE